MNRFRIAALLALLGALACGGTGAQEPPAGLEGGDAAADVVPLDHLPALSGDYFPLVSAGNGRTYHVYVRLPEGYDAAADRTWPVVYVLDGDSLFPILASTHLFLGYDEGLPEAIVVGIAYGSFDPAINRRNVDFTALGEDAGAGEGGAEQFHRFLRDQVIAQVERRHRADPRRRILVGQSRAGYFVLWSALKEPDLFQARIASNPSVEPAREQLFSTPAAHAHGELDVVVAVGAREESYRLRNGADWVSAWQQRDDAPWNVKLLVVPDGTHAASIGDAYRRAMLWVFRDRAD